MTAIERTAYPRLKKSHLRQTDLQLYVSSTEEIAWMKQQNITEPKLQLNFLVQLKTFQRLGYFIPVNTVPSAIVDQVRQALTIADDIKTRYRNKDTLRRHRIIIRDYMDIIPVDKIIDEQIEKIAFHAAQTMNDPADIINAVLENITNLRYELPKFSHLDRIVCRVRNAVNQDIFEKIYKRLIHNNKIQVLGKILKKDATENFTPYQRIKTLPKKVTINNFKNLISHHNWLMSFGDISPYLKDISKIKIAQFAEEARALDAAHIRTMCNMYKKYSLIACLLYESQCQTKDALALTLMRCFKMSDKAAQRHYESLDKDKDEISQNLAEFLSTLTYY